MRQSSGPKTDEQTVKRFIVIVVILLGVPSGRAEWRDLKEGMDPKTAQQFVGAPLIESKVRGGIFVTWIYDCGGYILFENGFIHYWQAPRPTKKA